MNATAALHQSNITHYPKFYHSAANSVACTELPSVYMQPVKNKKLVYLKIIWHIMYGNNILSKKL